MAPDWYYQVVCSHLQVTARKCNEATLQRSGSDLVIYLVNKLVFILSFRNYSSQTYIDAITMSPKVKLHTLKYTEPSVRSGKIFASFLSIIQESPSSPMSSCQVSLVSVKISVNIVVRLSARKESPLERASQIDEWQTKRIEMKVNCKNQSETEIKPEHLGHH